MRTIGSSHPHDPLCAKEVGQPRAQGGDVAKGGLGRTLCFVRLIALMSYVSRVRDDALFRRTQSLLFLFSLAILNSVVKQEVKNREKCKVATSKEKKTVATHELK